MPSVRTFAVVCSDSIFVLLPLWPFAFLAKVVSVLRSLFLSFLFFVFGLSVLCYLAFRSERLGKRFFLKENTHRGVGGDARNNRCLSLNCFSLSLF